MVEGGTSPRERRSVLRDEAALLLDGLLVRVARGRTALDVALCEGLGALSVGDRLLWPGWSGVGHYARERLGVAARTGQVMARLGWASAAVEAQAAAGAPGWRAELEAWLEAEHDRWAFLERVEPMAAVTRGRTSPASARPTTSTASTAASSGSAGWRPTG
jgi:hypothetical protein